ncbi:MAG TPA: RES family NAD+ phosphorylase [Terracidiphilus sp.]|nr:RES family NAD+ phosphorylase [Terracidiphilus sp.]
MAYEKEFHRAETHRLIPAMYADESVLESLSLPAETIANLSELDAATDERKTAERAGIPGIGPSELLYGVPLAQIVNAAFTHPGPTGGRFHDERRGAWYAGFELRTSIQEVAYHKKRFLKDGRIDDRIVFDYQDFLADFSGSYHFLDPDELKSCLHPEPVPECYRASQVLATSLLFTGSAGIVYPSVRRNGGTCIACFRPALVFHPRRGRVYRISVAANEEEVRVQEQKPKSR